VIDGGRIVEDGPIRDLRLAGGLFEPMWQLQAEGIAGAAVIEAASVVRGFVPADRDNRVQRGAECETPLPTARPVLARRPQIARHRRES